MVQNTFNSRKILWLAPRWPFPPDDGAKRATLELLRPLIELGMQIDFLGFPVGWEQRLRSLDVDSTTIQKNLVSCARVPRAYGSPLVQKAVGLLESFMLRTDRPYSVQSFHGAGVLGALRERWAQNQWDAVVLDGLHVGATWYAAHLENEKVTKIPVIYRAHNVESTIWEQAAQSVLPGLQGLARAQARKMRQFETQILGKVTAVAPVSEIDEARLRELVPTLCSRTIPIGSNFGDQPFDLVEDSTLRLLFVGKLSWAPNHDGLFWFLEKVWTPLLRDPRLKKGRRLELDVVGADASSDLVEKCRELGVRVHGRQDDLAPFYSEAHLTIAPVFVGSGTRVKIIESIQQGRPVLSTKQGAEGLSLNSSNAYLGETAEEWVQVIHTFDLGDARVKVGRAFSEFKSKYDSRGVAERFLQLLESARLK